MLMIASTICNKRNAQIMEASNDDPLRLIKKTQNSYSAFLEANERMETPIVYNNKYYWKPPPQATFVSAIPSPELAEALAASRAAEMIQRNGWHNILLEGDYFTVITRLRPLVMDDSYVSPILVDTTNILQSIHSWEVRHIRRTDNRVAHLLA
ncbi:hypothetical protein Salat_1185900 [Sesamum alatum]|uniref:RNase H type-1 domain-containing protein n=1 Tax=Sesamum alatum TaxID=300844 RepID=A0AAE1YEM1_9LAMI|nr:hypothetical protein Salat_1185900 [Sesamum alatum]